MKPDDIPQDVWETAETVWISYVMPNPADLHEQVARAIIAEREACAETGRSAVMKFKAKVGGRYYPGYHEDMRDAVASAIRSRS